MSVLLLCLVYTAGNKKEGEGRGEGLAPPSSLGLRPIYPSAPSLLHNLKYAQTQSQILRSFPTILIYSGIRSMVSYFIGSHRVDSPIVDSPVNTSTDPFTRSPIDKAEDDQFIL